MIATAGDAGVSPPNGRPTRMGICIASKYPGKASVPAAAGIFGKSRPSIEKARRDPPPTFVAAAAATAPGMARSCSVSVCSNWITRCGVG